MIHRFSCGVAVLCLSILAAMFGPAAAAQQKPADVMPPKMEFTVHTLTNGLQVIFLEDHAVPVINLQVWYHVGAKDELPGRTGFAHLFEHLMFKGSAHVPAERSEERRVGKEC